MTNSHELRLKCRGLLLVDMSFKLFAALYRTQLLRGVTMLGARNMHRADHCVPARRRRQAVSRAFATHEAASSFQAARRLHDF